jgi:type IV pilus assembly protein PilC
MTRTPQEKQTVPPIPNPSRSSVVAPSSAPPAASPRAAQKKAGQKKVAGARAIRMKELPTFTRQFSALLSSGMPVVYSLTTMEDQTINQSFKAVIAGVRLQIEGGAMLSEALKAFPDVFDELYVSMFTAGEQGGQLAETAARIAQYLEASSRLRRKVKSAMMYPAIVLCLALVLASGMIIWIVPVFASIYTDMGAKLPMPTQILVNVSAVVRSNALWVVSAIVLAGAIFSKWKKSPSGMYMWDHFKISVPVIGELNRKVSLARFAQTFAQLTRSGVPILRAMEIVSFATGNKVLGKVITDAVPTVERGEPLSVALDKSKVYPRMLINMLTAGEKTGKIDEMLQRISEFYNDEVETMLQGLTSLLEPLLIVFLGVIIGTIVVCMFLPIFKMGEIIKM